MLLLVHDPHVCWLSGSYSRERSPSHVFEGKGGRLHRGGHQKPQSGRQLQPGEAGKLEILGFRDE
jgi:hypothetical protein